MQIKKNISQNIIFLPGLITAMLSTFFATYWLINLDTGTLLELSSQLLDGKKLYRDVIEQQFPAIYLISMFIAWFAKYLDITLVNAFFLCTFLLLNFCIFVAWKIFKTNTEIFSFTQPNKKVAQSIFILILYYSLFSLPSLGEWNLDFGQREHLFCALILPYIATVLARTQNILITKPLAITAGALAAVGFCIKPHFLIILIASELFLVRKLAKMGTGAHLFFRPESITMLIILLIYYLSIFLFMPHYFILIPYFSAFYSSIAIPFMSMTLFCLFISLLPLLLLQTFIKPFSTKNSPEQAVSLLRRDNMKATATYLSLLGLASIIVFAAGISAFRYHLFPYKFFIFLLAAFVAFAHPNRIIFPAFCLLVATMTLAYAATSSPIIQDKRAFIFTLGRNLRQYAPNGPVVSFDTNLFPTFPALNYAEEKWGLSIPWILYIPLAYQDFLENTAQPPYKAPSQMNAAARFFHEKVIHDLEKTPPEVIMINASEKKIFLKDMPFDFIQHFLKDERFVKLWKKYRWVSRVSDAKTGFVFDFYQRQQ